MYDNFDSEDDPSDPEGDYATGAVFSSIVSTAVEQARPPRLQSPAVTPLDQARSVSLRPFVQLWSFIVK